MPLESFVEIKHIQDYILLRWIRTPNDSEMKEGLEAGLKLAKEKGVKKWLGDTTDLGPVPIGSQEWINTDWYPRCIQQITKMAIVVPSSALAKMTVVQIVSKVGNLESQFFDSPEEAATWLK